MAGTSTKGPEVASLCRLGFTNQEVADRTGVSVRTVTRVRIRYGLSEPRPDHGHRLTPEDHARAREWLQDGWSLSEISTTLGFGRQALYRYYKGQGWDYSQCARHARTIKELGRI